MRYTLLSLTVVLCEAALPGCQGQPGAGGPLSGDPLLVRTSAIYMTGTIGDYETLHRQPWDEKTTGALIRLEQKGETCHMGDVAAVIVHEYRENVAANRSGKPGDWIFDKNANEGHKQFTRCAVKQFGSQAPWAAVGQPATFKEVFRWIVAYRKDLPESKLLDGEIQKTQDLLK